MKLEAFVYRAALWLGLLLCSAGAVPFTDDEPEDIEFMRRNHRLTSVGGAPRPPGPVALHNAYVKHGIEVPEHLEKAARAATKIAARSAAARAAAAPNPSGTATGSVNGPDNGWLFPVTIGKTKNLKMVFDTGSADLWAFSTDTPASQRGNHILYNPKATGKRLSGYTFDITYGTGYASGIVYTDKVVAGDVTATAAVGSATNVAPFFTNGATDGLVGFAFSEEDTCSPQPCNTFWQQADKQCPTFWAFALRHNGPATWDFGFLDKSLYTGSIVYTSQEYYYPYGGAAWITYIQGFSTGNNGATKSSFHGLIDTGTSLLLVYPPIINAFYANVPGAVNDNSQGGIVFPCSSASKLPNLNFFFTGQRRTMPGSYGLYARINSTYCFGGVQNVGSSAIAIIGDVFLKSQYVVYNPCTNIVGLAQQKGVAI